MDGQLREGMSARNRDSDPYVGDDWSMTGVITPKPGNQDRVPMMHSRLRKLGACLYAPDSASSAPAVSKLRILGGIAKAVKARRSHAETVTHCRYPHTRFGHHLPSSRREFCGLTYGDPPRARRGSPNGVLWTVIKQQAPVRLRDA